MTIPFWLQLLSWIALAGAGLTMLVVIADVLRGPRQPMPIMSVVWPVTALYFGPAVLPFYFRLGRPSPSEGHGHEHGRDSGHRPEWRDVFVSATHCGAGCTLGDIVADIAILVAGLAIVPSAAGTSFILDFCVAYLFGILFQYLPLRAMGERSRLRALWKSIKADTASLVAFEIGLFGWMALVRLVWFPGLEADTALFWFMMQVGMVIGFLTTFPANWWLVKAGIKHTMRG